MAYTPGEQYDGLLASEYNTLMGLNNAEITAFLQQNFSPVNDGAYYVYSGDQMAFFALLEAYDLQDTYDFSTFLYLYSTWSVVGF